MTYMKDDMVGLRKRTREGELKHYAKTFDKLEKILNKSQRYLDSLKKARKFLK